MYQQDASLKIVHLFTAIWDEGGISAESGS